MSCFNSERDVCHYVILGVIVCVCIEEIVLSGIHGTVCQNSLLILLVIQTPMLR